MKHGLLIVNLGTPASPSVKDVRRFLREFLSDERVIDLPKLPRLALLYGAILPFRPFKTAKAYQEIWDDQKGSPLMYLSQSFTEHLQQALPDYYMVKLAMRYGEPSIANAVKELEGKVSKLTIIPMYPQFASSTTTSVIEACFKALKTQWNMPDIEVVSQFYDEPWFIKALKSRSQSFLDEFKPCHVLMSFHGLPVRQIAKSEAVVCDQNKPCPAIQSNNHFCYRAQCYQTARSLAEALNISDHYSVGFQSRLGRIPWIQPYIDDILPQLRAKGVKRLSVMCPSFVTDCLETIEEIGIRLRETWLELGGEAFQLVPALNDSPHFVQNFAEFIQSRQQLPLPKQQPLSVVMSK